jgi:mono/diheme cytochrome c family protein
MNTRFLMRVCSTISALAAALAFSVPAVALPEYQDGLFARYPGAAASLGQCVACHEDPSSGSLNPFGIAFLGNGYALNAALAGLDSDGDGFTNGVELTASPATAPGDPKSKPGSLGVPPVPPAATDGPTLYANNCAACHGALASSSKREATLARTQSAIGGNVGGMGSLSTLSTVQLQAIVSALAAAAPASSLNYTGMWWNPAESGWGINVNHQGDIVFATLFTYDERGAPMWVMMTGQLQADGRTYAGDLYKVSGPVFNAQPFAPITAANLFKVGTMSLTFRSASTATLAYTYQGAAVAKEIVPQVFGTAAASCSPTAGSRAALTNYQDMWWNPAESGWGVNIVHQNSTLFATLMTYDLAGNSLWLVMSQGLPQGDGSYLGDLYRANGPAFNAQPFTPITAGNLAKVGTMRFTFTDGITGALAYTVDGIPVSKSITRQVFATLVPACSSPVQPQANQPADGPTLYASHCAACHGALASSSKGNATLTRMQSAINGNVGGMGSLSTLSTIQLQAIVSALAPVAPPAPTVETNGPTLYANHCAACHGALASSTKGGATLTRMQNAIIGNVGGMGSLSALSTIQLQAIVSTLAPVAQVPAPACGSCHGLPPDTGEHREHRSRSCGTCHGAGYSANSVNSVTHNNGLKELLASTGWNPTSRSCANSCHGKESW